MAQPTMSLSQDQRLQMVLAPQLRQSLEMLQLPVLELRSLIQQEIEKNPTLEESTPEAPSIEIQPTSAKPEERKELDFTADFQALARLDDEWRDYFFQEEPVRRYNSEDAQRRQFFFDSLPQRESLQEHLMRQLELSGLSEKDMQSGEFLVGSVNDDGYLTGSLDELSVAAGCDPAHLQDILTLIQEFSPLGVGARDLRECLLLQLERLGKSESLAAAVVRDHIDALAAHKFADIARVLKVTPEEVQAAADFIATLDPKPGRAYTTEVPAYVLPEVMVQKLDGVYVVIINDEQLPHIRISSEYRRLMDNPGTTAEVKDYITQNVRSGVFLIKSIEQRQQTIYRIASEIVRVQTEFLDKGLTHLKPLTMSEVAAVVGVHETTVSRAVSGKYMKTPRGVFEMKYFFTPGLKTADGQDVSNKTVKDMICQMVAAEDPARPLSDQEILGKLAEKGVHIARRTVAKYRLVSHIQPSHMRRKTY